MDEEKTLDVGGETPEVETPEVEEATEGTTEEGTKTAE